MKTPSILEKFNVKPRQNTSMRVLLRSQLTRNVPLNWYTCNFKLNFLSRGQLESLNLDKIFLPLSSFSMLSGFFGNLIFAFVARKLCGNHLNNTVLYYKWNDDIYFLEPPIRIFKFE